MNDILPQLVGLPYFTTGTLAQYFGNAEKARVYATRWAASGQIIRLKQGYYVTKQFITEQTYTGRLSSRRRYMLTQILYPNSYLSCETVLSMHQLIPEQNFSLSLVSTHKTWKISNTIFSASYRHIKDDLMRGYYMVKPDPHKWPYAIAHVEKALVDWLWLQVPIRELSWFRELRLDFSQATFDPQLFTQYIQRCNSPKMSRILSFITQLDDYPAA